MELQPTELHERVPFFCGSYNGGESREFMLEAKLRILKIIKKKPKF
jgi:fructose-1,6-bisphosphatase I